jgi:hypothetical protein
MIPSDANECWIDVYVADVPLTVFVLQKAAMGSVLIQCPQFHFFLRELCDCVYIVYSDSVYTSDILIVTLLEISSGMAMHCLHPL